MVKRERKSQRRPKHVEGRLRHVTGEAHKLEINVEYQEGRLEGTNTKLIAPFHHLTPAAHQHQRVTAESEVFFLGIFCQRRMAVG